LRLESKLVSTIQDSENPVVRTLFEHRFRTYSVTVHVLLSNYL